MVRRATTLRHEGSVIAKSSSRTVKQPERVYAHSHPVEKSIYQHIKYYSGERSEKGDRKRHKVCTKGLKLLLEQQVTLHHVEKPPLTLHDLWWAHEEEEEEVHFSQRDINYINAT